jgi:hypothetical protein
MFDSKDVCLQGDTVNNGFVANIQFFGGDNVIHQLCVKSAEMIPLCGGELGRACQPTSTVTSTLWHIVE